MVVLFVPLIQLAMARPDSAARSIVVANISKPHFMTSVFIAAIASFASITRRPSWIGSKILALLIVIKPLGIGKMGFTQT